MFENDLGDLVSVEGVVHLATALGVFLDIVGRRVFLPAICITTLPQTFTRGEAVTIKVARWYAKQEKLVA
jgi:hypothetical protein